MARPCSVLFVWLLCAAAVSAQDPQQPSEQIDLRGEWRLNASLSDDVPLLPGEAMAIARASGAVRTGTRPARASRGPEHRALVSVRQVLRAELAASHLKVAHAGRTLTFTFGGADPLAFVADGRKFTLERDGVRFTVRAQWISPLLVIDREYEDGTTVSETFASFDDPRQLVATSTIQNERTQEPPITFTRVFEAAGTGQQRTPRPAK